jgi:hypothetical protein
MLAAHADGLGTCWIGFAEASLNQAAAKKEIGIPQHYRPIAPIILDTPAQSRRRRRAIGPISQGSSPDQRWSSRS